MGHEIRGVPEAAPLTDDVARKLAGEGETSIGGYLAGQRRMRGISLDDLAELTKIPRRSLERLEAGAFDAAADGFTRGFVRTVAVALGLDPEQTVMRTRSEPLPVDNSGSGSALARVLVAGVGLLALAGAGWLVWSWTGARPGPSAPPESEVVYRRDAVRELAESVRARQAPSEVEPDR